MGTEREKESERKQAVIASGGVQVSMGTEGACGGSSGIDLAGIEAANGEWRAGKLGMNDHHKVM